VSAPNERQNEQERARRYALGALAQSYAPRGLADVLNLSAQGRARARRNWRSQPRSRRFALLVIISVDVIGLGVMVWGFAKGNPWLILTPALVLAAVMVGTTIISVVQGVKRHR
jgi:hypothetical protein